MRASRASTMTVSQSSIYREVRAGHVMRPLSVPRLVLVAVSLVCAEEAVYKMHYFLCH
jgi:hypothetical protein